MSRMAKNKGCTGQREVKELYKEIHGLSDDDIECAIMGTSGTDIRFHGQAKKDFPYDVEVKRTEKASPWQWIEQAKARNEHYRIPFRRNRADWHMILPLEQYLNMEKELLDLRKKVGNDK